MSISQLGRSEPERHHRNEALSAGNDLRAVAMLRQQFAGLLDRGLRGHTQKATISTCNLDDAAGPSWAQVLYPTV